MIQWAQQRSTSQDHTDFFHGLQVNPLINHQLFNQFQLGQTSALSPGGNNLPVMIGSPLTHPITRNPTHIQQIQTPQMTPRDAVRQALQNERGLNGQIRNFMWCTSGIKI